MSTRQKAKDLVALAVDDRTPEKERITAALRAVKLIAKYGLLASPLDILDSENETVQAVRGIADVLLDPKLRRNVARVASGLKRRRRR
jgi:hypothetical protein